MADPKVPAPAPAAAAAPAETTTTERVVPKFSEVVAERTSARQGEIAESAGQPAAKVEPPAGDTAPDADVSDEEYSKWWDAQPKNLRDATAKRAYTTYNNAIADEYGDILPTIVAARENPKLRELLVELGDSTKKELLEYIVDPEIRKHAKDLTKTELREFLFNDALTAYNKYNVPTPGEAAADPRDARIQALETQFDDERTGRENANYIATRGNEVRAVRSAFSHMTEPQIAHVVQVVEERFETMAARKGIDTSKEGWAARAIRAGVAAPSYRDYAAQYSEVLGKQAPPAAPAGTSTTGDKGTAAPRDAAEAKKLAGVTALRDFKSKSPAFRQPATRR